MSATEAHHHFETGQMIRRTETSEPVWRDEEHRQRAFSAAAQSMICFLLYGEEVVRDVCMGDADSDLAGISTFSKLPIPMVCRPSDGEPRRGNPAPVSSDAIVDAHGVLQYSGAVAETLLVSWEARSEDLVSEAAQGRARQGRQALASLSKLVGRERSADVFYADYWKEAARLLRANWAGVVELADALGRHGSLSGTRSDQVLRNCQIA